MARSTSTTPAGSDADNLLAGLGAGTTGEDDLFAGMDDLLDEVEEDDSEGWVPTERGENLVGIVVKTGTVRSDFANDGEDPNVPTVTIQVKDGTKWRIIGYGAVLKRELIDHDPQPGDMMAIKYFGEKLIRKGKFAGKPYKHFQLAVKRAAQLSGS